MRPRSGASFGAATFTSAYRAPPVAQPASSVRAQSAKTIPTRMSTPLSNKLNDTQRTHIQGVIDFGNQDVRASTTRAKAHATKAETVTPNPPLGGNYRLAGHSPTIPVIHIGATAN